MQTLSAVFLALITAVSCNAQEKPAAKRFTFFSKPVLGLAAVQTGTMLADAWSTKKLIHVGGYEMNPLLGRYPSNARLAVVGSVTIISSAFLAQKMRDSHRFHKAWWIPQVSLSVTHTRLVFRNTALANRKY
jgi:hypothetical protein